LLESLDRLLAIEAFAFWGLELGGKIARRGRPGLKRQPMNLRALSLGVVVVLSLTACPGGSGGDGGTGGSSGKGGGTGTGGSGGTGGGTGGNVPLDQLCTQVESAYCDYFVRCGGFESKANCLKIFGSEIGGCAMQQLAGLDAGLILYNGQAAGSCINSLATAPCTGFNFGMGSSDICNQVFVGTVGIGSPCGFEGECIPTAYCDTGAASCGGTCKMFVAAGQPVGVNQRCAPGTQVSGGICQPEVAVGGNCASPDGGFDFRPCASPSNCFPDFLPDGGTSAICVTNAMIGQPCNDLDAGIRGCGDFSHCDMTSNTCVGAGGTDAGCTQTGQDQCKLDLWCNTALANPICQPLSPLGGPCVGASSCENGVCDGGSFGMPPTAGACVAPPGANDHCSGVCDTGLYCDFMSQTCKPRRADGQSCATQAECVSGTCSLPADAGAGYCGPCH
jgi:hypothetical protein